MPRCDECIYWQRMDGPYGDCHRHAPRPINVADLVGHDDGTDEWQWPVTHDAEWCGEHCACLSVQKP